jgi:hypothetical protein
LNVPKNKVIRSACATPPPGWKLDPTESLDTLQVLMDLYMHSLELEDDVLREAVLAKMRFYIVNGKFDHTELLHCLWRAYAEARERKENTAVQKVLLSGLVVNNISVLTGPESSTLHAMRRENSRLDEDYIYACAYYNHYY